MPSFYIKTELLIHLAHLKWLWILLNIVGPHLAPTFGTILHQPNCPPIIWRFQWCHFLGPQRVQYFLLHWGGATKVTRVTIVTFNCKQNHMANLSCSILRDGERHQWTDLVGNNNDVHMLSLNRYIINYQHDFGVIMVKRFPWWRW